MWRCLGLNFDKILYCTHFLPKSNTEGSDGSNDFEDLVTEGDFAFMELSIE